MTCQHPIWLSDKKMYVPCGRCFACRRNYASMWTERMMHELTAWDHQAVFLTLTYDDKHLIYSVVNRRPTLYKRDGQLFLKRLRKKLSKKQRKCKAVVVGEYGETTGRPHMHMIVYGLSLKTEDKMLVRSCWQKCESVGIYYGTVTKDSCRYVVDYVFKSAMSKADKEAYTRAGMEPPYKTSSNGLGLTYCTAHADRLKKRVSESNGAPLPRYYAEKLGVTRQRRSTALVDALLSNKEKFIEINPDLKWIYDIDNLAGYLGIISSTGSPVYARISVFLDDISKTKRIIMRNKEALADRARRAREIK